MLHLMSCWFTQIFKFILFIYLFIYFKIDFFKNFSPRKKLYQQIHLPSPAHLLIQHGEAEEEKKKGYGLVFEKGGKKKTVLKKMMVGQ